MSNVIVRAGFESRLKTWAAAKVPAIPIAYENAPFAPPAGRYVAAYLMPANTNINTLEGTDREYRGIFQASIIVPANAGSGEAQALAAELDALYGIGFTHGGLRITLIKPMSAANAIQDASGYTVPVSCLYRADAV